MDTKKRVLRACLLGACFGLVLTTFFFARRPAEPGAGPQADSARTDAPALTASQPAAVTAAAPAGTTKELPAPADAHWELPAAEPQFAAFAEWTRRYQQADAADRSALEAEGVELARQRHAAMYSLIHTGPRRALELTVPLAVREGLPASVTALLEERVSGRGDYAVLAAVPLPGQQMEMPPISRFMTVNGTEYRASVYGARAEHPTKKDLAFYGIALDGALAVSESPVRMLEKIELRRLKRAQPAEAICSVSGQQVAIPADSETLLAAHAQGATPVEVGGEVRWLCQYAHVEELRAKMLAAAGVPGSSAGEGATEESNYTEGRKRYILFRVAFSNLPTPDISSNSLVTVVSNMNIYWRNNSYGRTSVAPLGAGSDIVLVTLANPSTFYDGDAGLFRTDVRAAAVAQGVDFSKYDFDIIYSGSGQPSFSFGGLGYVGGPGSWVVGASSGITAHETGHNLGLPHANFWDTGGASAIGPGGNQEYGDPFDVMGGGNGSGAAAGHYVSKFKWRIGWISDADFPRITASGTYRIHTHDNIDARGLRGVRFAKDASLDYFLEFRQLYTGNNWMMNGIGLRWGSPSGSSSQLIDTTPGSPDAKNDSAIVIGRTFSDPAAGAHITPVAKGNTYPESLDVVVNLGTFPGNQAPRATILASTTNAQLNGPVTFTANATDANGDALAYYWEFGDGSWGDNSTTVIKTWTTAGEYAVRCTVSDMKGGTFSDSVIVRVGLPGTFTISGRVLNNGQPMQHVLVRASGTRYAYTDSDGTYTITRLVANSYTMSAQLHPSTFVTPFFSNPVTVGPSATNIDFLAVVAPQNDVVLVNTGAVWKYLADGSDQGTAWIAPGFNDAPWPSGPGQLGYGDGDEATVVGFGPDANNKYPTTYFRRAFNVPDPTVLTNFMLSFLRDDGGAVYLNGTEVLRDNLAFGATYTTLATDNSEDTTVVSIDPALVLAGTNVLAVEIHQVAANSSDLSFDLSLFATTKTNFTGLTAFYLSSPADNTTLYAPASVTVAAEGFADGPFTLVEFFANGVKIGEATSVPFTTEWPSPPAGLHTLSARGVTAGGAFTSAPVRLTISGAPIATTFIAQGSTWKYLDNGSNQGTNWAMPGFNDAAWASGAAELGYGDGDEATVVSFGGNANARFITTYFRRTFEVADPSVVTNLNLRLLVDDGAVVHLNGVEVYRVNLPAGLITSATVAPVAVEDDDAFTEAAINPALLVAGQNVVAVEVHQQSASSSDVSFNLSLAGQISTNRVRGAYVTAPVAGAGFLASVNVAITAVAVPADGETISKVEFYANGSLLGEDATAPYQLTWNDPLPGTHMLTALAYESTGSNLLSAPVSITVSAPPPGRQLVSPRALWRYLDDGSDAGTAWRARFFNDSDWRLGYARLGYGGDGELTTVSFGPDASKRYITTYFRHGFSLASLAGINGLRLLLSADDGAVVYVNGLEVYRRNLRSGTVSYDSLALAAVDGAPETNFISANINPAVLLTGTNVVAVEIHQAAINSSDLGIDLALIAESNTNTTQGVYLTGPAAGALITMPAPVDLAAFAVAAGDTVTKVEFFANGAKVGEDLSAPHSFSWSGVAAGSYSLAAVARLGSGASLTSAPVAITVAGPPLMIASVLNTFLTAGSTWRYWSNGVTPAVNWNAREYNDGVWPQGAARFGWGLDGEVTTLPPGKITHYFRRWFNVPNSALIDTLIVQLQRDDGAVVYLNGTELFRSNMPVGGVSSNTLAAAGVDGLDEQQFFISVLPASGLVTGTNLLAVEMHQNSATSSDAGFDLSLTGSGDTSPRVVFSSPANNAAIVVPATVNIEATTWAGTGRSITNVEFFANGGKIGEATVAPYQFAWVNPPSGTHVLTLRARDNFGSIINSDPISITVGYQVVTSILIPSGSVWKYLDNGSNQGTNFAQRGFNDGAWVSGPAELGYGDGGEATVVSFGPSSSSKYITTYFRRWFTTPPDVTITNLSFRLLRDDGALVWLNGRDMYRSNLPPTGVVAFNTAATATVSGSGETTYYITTLATTNVVAGTNLVAVEIHQDSGSSSDISFDLEVTGTGYLIPVVPPELLVEMMPGGLVRVSWAAPSTGFELYGAPALDGPWTPSGAPVSTVGGRRIVTLTPGAAMQFYQLTRP